MIFLISSAFTEKPIELSIDMSLITTIIKKKYDGRNKIPIFHISYCTYSK